MNEPCLSNRQPLSVASDQSDVMPLVGVIMGSASDRQTMQHTVDTLTTLGIAHEVRVVSAHRTPALAFPACTGMTTASARAHGARSGTSPSPRRPRMNSTIGWNVCGPAASPFLRI